MKTQLQQAWREYCESTGERVDQVSFVAGWEACHQHVGRSIDELAFLGRQLAAGTPEAEVEAQLRPAGKNAA